MITYSTYNGYGRQYKNVKTTQSLWAVGQVKIDLGSDAAGDLFFRNNAGALQRLPLGTVGYVLTSDGAQPQWLAPAGGGGGGVVYSAGTGISIVGSVISNAFTKTSQLTNDSGFLSSLAHVHNIGNSSGTAQFSVGVGETLRIIGAGGTTIGFDSATKAITINTPTAHTHGIANSTGTQQFTFAQGENVRFAGTGGVSVSFDAASKTVTFNSSTGVSYSAGTGIAISGGVISNTITGTSQLTNDAGFVSSIAHNHYVANSSGTQQFAIGVGEAIRFAGANGNTITYDAATKTVTITAPTASGGTTYSAGTGIAISAGNVISNTFTKTSQLTNDSGFVTSLAHNHIVYNSAGTQQFTVGVGEGIRFEGLSGIAINFDPTTKKVSFSGGAVTLPGTQLAVGNASNVMASSADLTFSAGNLAVNAGANSSAGISIDGTSHPALNIKSGGVAKGLFGLASASGAYFANAAANDIALRATTAAARVLIGQGSGNAELIVGATTKVNSLIGTNTRMTVVAPDGTLQAQAKPSAGTFIAVDANNVISNTMTNNTSQYTKLAASVTLTPSQSQSVCQLSLALGTYYVQGTIQFMANTTQNAYAGVAALLSCPGGGGLIDEQDGQIFQLATPSTQFVSLTVSGIITVTTASTLTLMASSSAGLLVYTDRTHLHAVRLT